MLGFDKDVKRREEGIQMRSLKAQWDTRRLMDHKFIHMLERSCNMWILTQE
jgi:hypothetical protein